ncbi:hypothetical protein L596_011961 [Steinernema carpocapsae]|uniref:Uncharacterized protein n=1 Tax=Steinernema carpocapsae TaxID=34508 RepID=A0A4U5NVN9_STECR|nr:hypothetical protein L596_011961 [Steinernema carpocapsae]
MQGAPPENMSFRSPLIKKLQLADRFTLHNLLVESRELRDFRGSVRFFSRESPHVSNYRQKEDKLFNIR